MAIAFMSIAKMAIAFMSLAQMAIAQLVATRISKLLQYSIDCRHHPVCSAVLDSINNACHVNNIVG